MTITLLRRRLMASSALAAITAPLRAQAYPDKPLHIVVPSPPGGSTDQLARLVGHWLQNRWERPVVIDNKPGAGLRLGAEAVARSSADGYTLLMAAVHHSIAQAVYSKRSYELERDLAPVSVIAVVPNVLIVPAAFPARTVAELIAAAKAAPGTLSYGSTGLGTAHHLIGEQFNQMAGTRIEHVPYKGSTPALVDLMSGQIQVMFDTVASCLPHIRSSKLRALAVATATRSSALPEVPALAEAGLPGFDIASWFGLMVPAGTPEAIVNRLHAEVLQMLAATSTRVVLTAMGAEAVGNSPVQMGRQIAGEVVRFAALARQAHLQLD